MFKKICAALLALSMLLLVVVGEASAESFPAEEDKVAICVQAFNGETGRVSCPEYDVMIALGNITQVLVDSDDVPEANPIFLASDECYLRGATDVFTQVACSYTLDDFTTFYIFRLDRLLKVDANNPSVPALVNVPLVVAPTSYAPVMPRTPVIAVPSNAVAPIRVFAG